MPFNDYICRECGHKLEYQDWDPVLDAHCLECDQITRWDRVWEAPHIGRGSSGEPPR